MFCKIGVLENFAKFSRNTSVLDFLFSKVTGLRLASVLIRDSSTGVFL